MNLYTILNVLINWIRIWTIELVRYQDSGAFKSRFVSCLQTQDKDVTVMSDVWYNRNILTQTRIRIYRAAVLLYGSVTWTAIKSHVHRVEVFHQRCLRRIMRIKFFSNTINEIVLQRAGIENVAIVISRNRLRWFGMWPWHGIRISSERLPKNYSSGSRRTEKDPETDLASLGLIVSKKITTLLLDGTPMSKI